MQKLDLINKRFYKLLVLAYLGTDSTQHTTWRCMCDCGTTCVVQGAKLTKNIVRSCGCQMRSKEMYAMKKRHINPLAGWQQYYNQYIQNNKKRGHLFELSLEQFIQLCSGNCFYCERPPVENKTYYNHMTKKAKFKDIPSDTKHRIIFTNGIDRIDSSQGYKLSNVRTCCRQCNKAKLDYPEKDFLDWVKQVYHNIYGA